jgi:molybdopterin-guanine dinucleotide biosynthesis protein B
VGKKNSGKTTFIERLVRLLVAQGLAVACIKHDVHGFDMDREGSDTSRMAQAGASPVVISSPEAVAKLERAGQEKDLDELRAELDGKADIIIAEGFKSSGADRVEISRDVRSGSLACPEDELIAVICDRPQAAGRIPWFGLGDIEAVARFLVERYSLRAATAPSFTPTPPARPFVTRPHSRVEDTGGH